MQREDIDITKKDFINKLVYAVLIAALIALSVWGIYQYRNTKEVKARLENSYNRAFHDLVDYVDDIQTSLNKGMLVSSSSQMASLSSEIFRKAASAKACLGELPVYNVEINNTSKFLSQVGDYTYTLSQKMINGEKLSDEEYQNMKSLNGYAEKLNTSLSKMQEEVYSGNIQFGEIAFHSMQYLTDETQSEPDNIVANLQNIEKEFQEYPSLIYDGPFSEHIENMKPVMLENASEINSETALENAKAFLGERGEGLALSGETQNSSIDAYSFCADIDGREICIDVTKKGGNILYFLDNRAVSEEKIDFETAAAFAESFLSEKGFASMKKSYYDKGSGIAIINFAYVQDNVTCYSDLIKVRVALDNGEILGIECRGYIMNHREREFPASSISESEAKAKINSNLNVDGVNLALIPKDSLKEVFCYEFHGKYEGKNFIIYINAENGREEKILMLIESENGVLTI